LHRWIKSTKSSCWYQTFAKKLLQMDNYVKDNISRYLLAFLSLLIVRKMFEEVKLGFLIVGHAHEDIDKCFGYLSKKLREQNNSILANLMKVFMVSQNQHFILQLI
jgi:hypothetical protein